MIQEVAVLAAVPADLEAGDQAEAAGVVETDQGPARAGAEDPDPGSWKISTVVVPWSGEHIKFCNSQSLGDALANRPCILSIGKRIHQVQVNAC